jgi:hypothetical protein
MTTSNPNVPQTSGAAHPDGEDHDQTVDPLLRDKLAGAVPDDQASDEPEAASEPTDSVEEDRKASGAD